jgi:ankyrin repeat protein
VIQLLLGAGADVNTVMEGAYGAAGGGNQTVVRQLLDVDVGVNAVLSKSGYDTALIAVVSGGHEAIVRQLLDAGANVNEAREKGHGTALQAAVAGYETITRRLLEAGADVNAVTEGGYGSALIAAASEGHGLIIRSPSNRWSHHASALHWPVAVSHAQGRWCLRLC